MSYSVINDKCWANKLFFGDNLGILRESVGTESVDLVYLDPPSHYRYRSALEGCFSKA